jgi:dihydropteroate synthase
VIEALRARTDVVLSIDTTKVEVARAALDAGAEMINEVSACTAEEGMADLAAQTGAGLVLMHMQGTPRTMQEAPHYDDVVAEVAAFLAARVEAVVARGVAREALAVDPGIGFGKSVEHNLRLLARLDALAAIGRPVLVGLSRKSFIGKLTGAEVGDRLPGSLAALAGCVAQGVHVMRVHDVKESRQAACVARRIMEAQT